MQLRPALSAKGQAFIDQASIALQKKIEEKIESAPGSFGELEKKKQFRKFAYRSHVGAYCESGWKSLPQKDRNKVIDAIDNADKYKSFRAVITATSLTMKCGDIRDSRDIFVQLFRCVRKIF